MEKPLIDIDKWHAAGFKVDINFQNNNMNISKDINGFVFKNEYFIPARLTIKGTFDIVTRKGIGFNAKNPDYERIHPHVHATRTGAWAGMCMGEKFPGAFNEAVFMDDSPEDYLGLLNQYLNNYNPSSVLSGHIRDMGWKTVLKLGKDGKYTVVNKESIPDTGTKDLQDAGHSQRLCQTSRLAVKAEAS